MRTAVICIPAQAQLEETGKEARGAS
jgi:hypothetical protein